MPENKPAPKENKHPVKDPHLADLAPSPDEDGAVPDLPDEEELYPVPPKNDKLAEDDVIIARLKEP